MADLETNQNIEELRARLSEKLEELHRRANTARTVLTPWTYWRSPWLKLGIATLAGAGVAIATTESRRARAAREASRGIRGLLGPGPVVVPARESLLGSLARAALVATVTSLVPRLVRAALERDEVSRASA